MEINGKASSKTTMRKLSKKTLQELNLEDELRLMTLPEKVLQFGTGVLLRALPDYIIDQANREGRFNGRVVVVKSTSQGGTDAFSAQDSLYTVCIKGYEDGKWVEKKVINTAISRVVSAQDDWQRILEVAESPDLEVILSNTTEVGIVYQEENIQEGCPTSFPGKLLAVLFQRFKKLGSAGGIVVIPTELISNNGEKLQKIVEDLSDFNNLGADFRNWLGTEVTFCNSLVDRIVPGSPKGEIGDELRAELNYEDDLLIMAEPYGLWAISGDAKVKEKLSFVGHGAFVEQDITKYKELKLRLLNGTHTMTCGLAFFAGFKTVKEAMQDTDFANFLTRMMEEEIGPSIPYALAPGEAGKFGSQVIDRFRNPSIEHFWLNITLNFTQKIEMRIVALLQQFQSAPKRMAAGLAAYILFMRPVREEGGKWYGSWQGEEYWIQDQQAPAFLKLYSEDAETWVKAVLGKKEFWGQDLNELPGLTAEVSESLRKLLSSGAKSLLS
jgi:tagaturonate reductase